MKITKVNLITQGHFPSDVMPTHEMHRRVNEFLTGDDGDWVNKFKDSSAKRSGPNHRKDFVHSTEAVALASGFDPLSIIQSIIHDATDATGITNKQSKAIIATADAVSYLATGKKARVSSFRGGGFHRRYRPVRGSRYVRRY